MRFIQDMSHTQNTHVLKLKECIQHDMSGSDVNMKQLRHVRHVLCHICCSLWLKALRDVSHPVRVYLHGVSRVVFHLSMVGLLEAMADCTAASTDGATSSLFQRVRRAIGASSFFLLFLYRAYFQTH